MGFRTYSAVLGLASVGARVEHNKVDHENQNIQYYCRDTHSMPALFSK